MGHDDLEVEAINVQRRRKGRVSSTTLLFDGTKLCL